MTGTTAVPVVSIGLPVYNGERYLRGALDALLNQTFGDFELIISDNASTDGTEAICREYAARDARIRYIRHPENQGALFNFDFVLQEARGTYFLWAAVDDLWSANFLEVLRDGLEADPGAVGAQGEYALIGADGAPLSESAAQTTLETPSRIGRLLLLARQRVTNIYVYGLFRTAVLQQMRLRPLPLARKYAQSAEYPILFYLAAAGTVRTDRRACFFYRQHPGQESHRKQSAWIVCAIRLGLMIVLPKAVWKGSRSPAATLVAAGAVAFYQTRSLVWYILSKPFAARAGKPVPASRNPGGTTGQGA
ncbi:MAG TPA: glycosyltransferase [Chthonomonadaceae bacterium]|nr:glycosyltransferase [Chthonomonadaceae bacterium]